MRHGSELQLSELPAPIQEIIGRFALQCGLGPNHPMIESIEQRAREHLASGAVLIGVGKVRETYVSASSLGITE